MKSFTFDERQYPVKEMPPEFVEWNLGQRKTALRKMRDMAQGKPPAGKGGGFGAHLPVVITNNPEGSPFAFNAANKGTGFVAKDEYIEYWLEKFQRAEAASRLQRIDTILEFYEDTDKIDLRCLAGLEIWPGHTSKNFERDPRVGLHFLGMPAHGGPMRYLQWQVNCMWEKISPGDKRFAFGVALRRLTMGHGGFVPGHIPVEQTPARGGYPNGWVLWVVEVLDKGIEAQPA